MDAWLILFLRMTRNSSDKRKQQWIHSGIMLSLVVAMLAVVPIAKAYYFGQDRREDWKGAGEILALNRQPSDTLIFLSKDDRYYMKHYLPDEEWRNALLAEDKEQLRKAVSQNSPAWVLVTPYTSRVNPQMEEADQWLREMKGIPFEFSQRFKLYFFWPDQDKETLLGRAREWSAPERLHWWKVVGGPNGQPARTRRRSGPIVTQQPCPISLRNEPTSSSWPAPKHWPQARMNWRWTC